MGFFVMEFICRRFAMAELHDARLGPVQPCYKHLPVAYEWLLPWGVKSALPCTNIDGEQMCQRPMGQLG